MIQEVTLSQQWTSFKNLDHAANFRLAARIFVVFCAMSLPLSRALSNIIFLITPCLILCGVGPRAMWQTFKTHPVVHVFFGYFLLLALGLTYTSAPWNEAVAMFSKYNKMWTILPLFALPFKQKWFRATILAFVFMMLLTAVLGYLKIFGIWNINPEVGPTSVFSRHITTSWFMSIACFLVLNYFLVDIKQRWFAIIPLLVMVIYTLFCNDGRTGYVVLIALFAYALWWHVELRGLIIAGIVLPALLVSAYHLSPSFHERIHDMAVTTQAYQQGDQTATSMSMRIRFIQNSFHIIRQHPFFGSGTGSLLHEMQQFEENPVYQTRNPHNEFVNQWVQLGTFGLLCWLLFLAVPWTLAKRYPVNRQTVIRGVIVALSVGSLMNSLLMDSLEGHLYVFFIALTMAMPLPGDSAHAYDS